MHTLLHYITLLLVLAGLGSCRKVIDVKLKNSEQKYVIEGEINDGAGPYIVTISRTRDFTENNAFDQVGGAKVIITDVTAGTHDTLHEISTGTYQTATIKGTPGNTYRLDVLINGKTFTASSAMPLQAVVLDTLFAARSSFGNDDIYMTPVFTDPLGKGNYYRQRQWIRGVLVKGSSVRSDEAADGITYRSQLFYDTDKETGNPVIHLNDSIAAELQCVNRQVYDYYRTLMDATGDNSATPANPLNNITGGALGIFNTCTARKKTVVAVY